ncbi:MAG: hypothetical protein E6G60_22175 [Actinobacteria bacterium]|nr:MAG: hypothetical protein E6G60_22175 [Actinomycetota bacterium]
MGSLDRASITRGRSPSSSGWPTPAAHCVAPASRSSSPRTARGSTPVASSTTSAGRSPTSASGSPPSPATPSRSCVARGSDAAAPTEPGRGSRGAFLWGTIWGRRSGLWVAREPGAGSVTMTTGAASLARHAGHAGGRGARSMKRRWTRLFIVVAVVTIAAAALPASAAGTAATTDDFEHGTLVVRYAAGTSSQQQADIARRNGATIRAVHESSRDAASTRSGTRRRVRGTQRHRARVPHAQRHVMVEPVGPGQDSTDAGWSVYPNTFSGNQGSSANGAKVAVVDTGILSTHPDLNDGRVLTGLGANCINPSSTCGAGTTIDDYGHGTHVAGSIAAITNNGTGVAGVAFNSSLIPVKVLNSSGSGTDVAVANRRQGGEPEPWWRVQRHAVQRGEPGREHLRRDGHRGRRQLVVLEPVVSGRLPRRARHLRN